MIHGYSRCSINYLRFSGRQERRSFLVTRDSKHDKCSTAQMLTYSMLDIGMYGVCQNFTSISWVLSGERERTPVSVFILSVPC